MRRASSLATAEFDDPYFVIPGLVVEGVTLLSGSPKVGKSWMVLNMCIAVATGGMFLSDVQCNLHQCLYLALEDTERRLKSRLQKVMGWEDIPHNMWYDLSLSRFPLGLKELEAFLIQNPDVKMIILDTLEMIRPPRRSNPYEDDYRAMAGLRVLAAQYHVAFVVVHHNRKTSTSGDGSQIDSIEKVSGTQALTGSVDTVLVLTRERGTTTGQLDVTGRDVREAQLAITLDKELGVWIKTGATGEHVPIV